MISVEAARDGFTLSVNGRRALIHGARRPCFELGRADYLPGHGSSRPRLRHASLKPLRGFSVLESGSSSALVAFDGGLRVRFACEGGLLRMTFSGCDAEDALFRARFVAVPDERIHGLGARSEPFDLKGSRLPLWVQDGRHEGGFVPGGRHGPRHASPFPVPAFVSSADYWCAVDVDSWASFDFRRRSSTLVETWSIPREIALGFEADAPRAFGGLGAHLGRQAQPPAWTWDGAWLGIQGGSGELQRKVGAALDSGARVAAVHVPDWCGRRAAGRGWSPRWDGGRDEALYPDLPATIARLKERGIRFLGYLSPLLPAGGVLHAEAGPRGFCVKDREGADYLVQVPAGSEGGAVMLDLSHPEARAWIKARIRTELLGIGMSGWLADSGFLPTDAVLASGEAARLAHNRWPALWARTNLEAIEEAGRARDALFVMRSGWFGSTRAAPSFAVGEGFADSVPAALALSSSGAGFVHAEAAVARPGPGRGGQRAVLLRRMELAAFSPAFRTGEGERPGDGRDFWADAVILGQLARMSGVHSALKPYHAATAAEYGRDGLPPIRHPWMHYEDDPALRRLPFQYLYGRDLLMAPSVRPDRELVDLVLPDDRWVHLWSSRAFGGGQTTVESPAGFPAVFYRAASPFAPLFDAIRRTARRPA